MTLGEKAAQVFLATGKCAVTTKYAFREAKRILRERYNIETKGLSKAPPPFILEERECSKEK